MKTTKQRFETFSAYDHTGIGAHLERMAERGWLLEKIGNFTWHYRRIEPQRLTFSVCYFPKASAFDPGPSEEQETFYDFCAHTGWTLAASAGQMQVFYNERENPVPIDTDPALEVEAIHQSAKKGFLLSHALLASVAVLNLAVVLSRLHNDPIQTLAMPSSLFLMVCWPVLLLVIGMDAGSYFHWRHRALRAAAQGEFLATSSHPLLQKVLLAVVIVMFAWSMSASGGVVLSSSLALLAGTAAIILITGGIREALKRERASAAVNRAVTLASCVVLTVLMVAAVSSVVLGRMGGGGKAAPEELPLTLDDLALGGYDSSDALRQSESPLLAWFEAYQSPWRHGDMADGAPELRYTVTVVKLPILYDMCKNHLLYQYDTRGTGQLPIKYFQPIGPAPWGAGEAYRFVMDDTPQDIYLLCYEERIVRLDLDWEPTPAQMAVVGEKLGGR